ncbi:type I secretion system permease/ATPase [Motilimonas pumila]|uniref:Type I secretion system permease/ATPase n=1 Tax=Motilimonas pumila TaxID=2303987 RepID=A0A418YFI7_9GAMM|nr:type I secretion system permease/ATPase [Motilimonas pumila]RJG47966.1 type I secretion system permease/ATPase [Motilimonas pumila]
MQLTSTPWTEAVSYLARHFAKRCHLSKVLAGLPLGQSGLTAEHLSRALANAGLHGQLAEFSDITCDNLPLLLQGAQGPVIVTQIEGDHFILYDCSQQVEVTLPRQQVLMDCEQVWRVSAQQSPDPRVEPYQKSSYKHWFWAAMDQVKPWYRDLILASLLVNLLALVVPLFTMNVYDRVVPNAAFDTLWVLATGALLALIFDWILRQARCHLTDMAGRQVDLALSSQLFAKTMGMKLSQRPQSAGAFSKQIQEFDSVRDFLTSATMVTLVDLPFTLLFFGLIYWLGGYMVFIPVSIMCVVLLLSLAVQPKVKQALEETGKLSTARQAHLVESLNNLVETKQINGEGEAQRRWEQTVAALADWNIKAKQTSSFVTHFVMNSQHLVTIGLIVVGVYQIAEGILSMGALIAIVMLSGRSASAVNQVSGLLLRYQQSRSAIQGLEAVMALEQENSDGQVVQNSQFSGRIKLQNVAFQYPDQDLWVLQDINLSLKPGEKVAVLGSAGAGKSTLLALLANQLSASQGQLNYDDIDAKLWPPSLVRQHTGWVSQQPQLFFGSVLENITAGCQHLDEQHLSKVLLDSGVASIIGRLSAGLESQVGEFGRCLSGGQRQTVALARALLRKPQLLLLDEPTSAMDQQTERHVLKGLAQAQCAMVVVTHKPAVLALCDRVIIMEQGKVIADGPKEQVLPPAANVTPVEPSKQSSAGRVKSVKVSRSKA